MVPDQNLDIPGKTINKVLKQLNTFGKNKKFLGKELSAEKLPAILGMNKQKTDFFSPYCYCCSPVVSRNQRITTVQEGSTDDSTTVPVDSIKDIIVLETIKEGQTIFKRD